MSKWIDLAEKIAAAPAPSEQLDADLLVAFGEMRGGIRASDNAFTSSLDAITALIREELPGWSWTAGLCYLTGHASLGPDYNDPVHRDRLEKEFPVETFGNGFDVDLPPGDGGHRTCMALCFVLCLAMAEIEKN